MTFALLALLVAQDATTVGMPARVTVTIPGPAVEARPLDDRSAALVVRVVKSDAGRYELEYYALVPGSYDLAAALRRADGSPVPPIPVRVDAVLKPGQILPHDPTPAPAPRLGGYTLALIAAGVVWAAGLAAILLVGRPKRVILAELVPPPTLADRLRPLVTEASEGRAEPARLAELERALHAFWRKRLGVEADHPAAAMAALRGHAEAGPLLEQLERWLHRPGREAVDVEALLRPYRDLPPEALELTVRR